MLVHTPTGKCYRTRRIAAKDLGEAAYKKAVRKNEIIFINEIIED